MSKVAARDNLTELMVSVLHGPYAADELLKSNPSDTYLTGVLWPKDSTLDSLEDDGEGDPLSDGSLGAAEFTIPGYRAIRPCSIGITCIIESGASIEVSLAGTARYKAEVVHGREEEFRPIEEGSPHQSYEWRRSPLDYRIKILDSESRSHWRTSNFLSDSGQAVSDPGLAIDIKRRVGDGVIVLTVTLINLQVRPEEWALSDVGNVFQAKISIHAHVDGAPAIIARRSLPVPTDEDQLVNALLYRDVEEYAVGHGVSAHWPDELSGKMPWVATSWLPVVSVKGMDPKGHARLKPLQTSSENPFSAATLASGTQSECCSMLDKFVELYAVWIHEELQARKNTFTDSLLRAAELNLTRCELTLSRLRRGVAILRKSDEAWRAFALANSAMDIQARFPSKGDRAGPLVWRPFQLAFLLLVVPSLVSPEEDAEARRCMDLLWFPTGGGKTEAYLALTAFQIFYRRLTSAPRRAEGGVDVLMRYTMRLLTIQQFQRATALIVACEQLRLTDSVSLGSARISIGLYAGGDATPNRIGDAQARLADEQLGAEPASTPRQLLECPVCGAKLSSHAYTVNAEKLQMAIVCAAPSCLLGGKALPVMTVDDVIYAEPPSLLVGVVDKFAQLPRRGDIRKLFGLDSELRPGLIVQDELHLISGPLGSMSGLYEAAIDRLCTVDGIPPKIIGSTATIGRAAEQVRALFDRDVLQFPPPGFDSKDSFFAIRDDQGPDRRYIGLASAGRSPKFALQAVLAAVSQIAATLRESGSVTEADVDPLWTCVAYFNSLRELGGAHVLVMDDVPRQMQFIATMLGSSARVYEDYAKELSGRASTREIPQRLIELGQSLGGSDPFAPMPVDMVLASNMISVGVDVPRLGLMVVNGQPKSTAEYIQASSRVGRGLPGLVVTLYNFGRPRDLSHFEHFSSYHAALYRSVEATSVTPWAARARDKALHAVFIALVRNLVTGLLGDRDAANFDPNHPIVKEVAQFLLRRADAATRGLESVDARHDLTEIIDGWHRRGTEAKAAGGKLNYWEKATPFGKPAPALMYSAEGGLRRSGASWPTPNSMREVEPSSAFIWKQISKKEALADE